MTALTFDTHRFIGKLKDAGMNEEQAEAVADAMRDVQNGWESVTRQDLANTESNLRHAILLSETALKKDMAELKYDLLKWIIGLSMAQFALIIGILIKLPH